MLRGDVTITTIDLSCVKIMSVKLHAEYRILWASLCASFALFSQKLREWQLQSAYFLNTPRISLSEDYFVLANSVDSDEMLHLGFHCCPEYTFMGHQYTKGLAKNKL